MKPLDTDADPRVVGPFELLARLGEGGMGVAYLARRIPLDGLSDELAAAYNLVEPDGDAAEEPRLVVVKMIQPKLLDGEPQYRERFGREIDAVRAVVSGRVPALIAFEEDPAAERPWFAMDYIAGPSLHTMIKESGTFGVGPYAALGLALVEALQAIHGTKLLHRDLKPSNVVLGPDGPVVLDFGLAVLSERQSSAALTQTGDRMGTRPYMPVEQLRDTKHVKEPADVYALGATLFFALTGRPPYPVMPLMLPPKWDGVDTAYLPLLAQILVANPLQRPDLDAVRESLLTLLADADLTPELAAEQLSALVESAALTPQPPSDALADPVAPEVQELVRQAMDADLPDMDPGFYGIVDTDEIELAVDEIEPAPEPPAPAPAPVDPQPTPTSYPLPPPRPPQEPQPPVPQAPPRAAQKIAAELRKRYAHRGTL
ncbi:serine/threonine-protein kinase [Streptomyces sp. S.PB5]|uniref:serine/threonine-protein kinase n=1 Tax=Streptomyces sp. S.PB5 TaxID=3020844 RepID=UPI0025B1BCB5|nr:serine/threonine-protein kinase [Streptomyces sp. S.PB5]MDN3020604.1 serine/threonine-protein kinase [Streptomyces sp. S.PB5]